MEDRPDAHRQVIRLNPLQELAFVHVIGDIQFRQITEIGAVGQIVNNENVCLAPLIKCVDNVRSDETGTASDDNHGKAPENSVRAGLTTARNMAAILTSFTHS